MSLEAVRGVFEGVPSRGGIMFVRRDSGGKTLGAVRTRQLDLLVSVQTTLLAARRLQSQRCKANERSQVPASGYWHAQKHLWQMAPQRQPAPAAAPIDGLLTTGRRPRHRGARVTHPRALI